MDYFIITVLLVNAQTSFMFVDSTEGLRVRNRPSLNSEIIYLLPNKSKVEVIQENNEKINLDGILGNWILVNHNTIRGWVFSGYLVPNIEDVATNWINCINYKFRERSYPISIEECNHSDTSAFEFIAKILKDYFYPNVITKDFYLSFCYPLVRHIPKNRSGIFEETDLVLQEDNIRHYIKFTSDNIGEDRYIINIGQYRNDSLIKEMRFSIIFFENYINIPEFINEDLEKSIKIIDLLDKDLELKIRNAYILKELYEETGIEEGIFSKIIIEKFDFDKIRDTNYFDIYYKILKENNIYLTENELEILNRKLYFEILNYK
jgi:hypothetical protein